MFGKLTKNLAKKHGYPNKPKQYEVIKVPAALQKGCGCKLPKRHRDCSYCGVTSHQPDSVCGMCREMGIDGKLIRGTGRKVCSHHKE